MQLTHKLDVKFKTHKLIINVDNVQYNLKIFIIFFNDLMIIIIETLSNDHVNFKFNNINEKLKIIKNQSIDDIFASFNIIDNKFQNNNENQKKIIFIIQKNIFDDILSVKFNHHY